MHKTSHKDVIFFAFWSSVSFVFVVKLVSLVQNYYVWNLYFIFVGRRRLLYICFACASVNVMSAQHQVTYSLALISPSVGSITQKLVEEFSWVFCGNSCNKKRLGNDLDQDRGIFCRRHTYGTAALYQHSLDGVTSLRQQEVNDVSLQLPSDYQCTSCAGS